MEEEKKMKDVDVIWQYLFSYYVLSTKVHRRKYNNNINPIWY